MPPTMSKLRSSLVALGMALALLTSAAPGVLAESMSDDEFEQRLSQLQDRAEEAFEHYEVGDTEEALEDARAVREAFAFESEGSSALEQAIKEASAVSIGDRVKAEADRFVGAIESGHSVEEVREIKADLVPSLNRLVLVSQGKHAPASQRELKTDEAIDEAHNQVLDAVDRAVQLYADGDQDEAKQAAKDAFFTYETNGMGPDTSVVDEPLENEVENRIQNFNASSDELGLVGLIGEGASLEEVREQADRIRAGLEENVDLLKATKPPRDIGDANGDGQVTIVDALVTAQASLGIRSEASTMDANQDGTVTIVDALLISQAALGIRSL